MGEPCQESFAFISYPCTRKKGGQGDEHTKPVALWDVPAHSLSLNNQAEDWGSKLEWFMEGWTSWSPTVAATSALNLIGKRQIW